MSNSNSNSNSNSDNDNDNVTIEIQREDVPSKTRLLTDDIKKRVIDAAPHPFAKAILEYLLDTERTIQPPVGRMVLGSAIRTNRETKEEVEIPNAIAVFPEGKDDPQILGTGEDLGIMVVRMAIQVGLTPAEVIPVIMTFEKVENFIDYYGEHFLPAPEGCNGDCENCTLHDEPQVKKSSDSVAPEALPGAPKLQDLQADLLLRNMPDERWH